MPRIVRFHEYGDADVLRIEELPAAEPGPGQVRLKVEAFALNRAEVLLRRKLYFEQPTLPARLGYDAAGVIDAVGPGVSDLRVGDRVLTVPAHAQSEFGVYGEWAIVPAGSVLKYPARLTPEKAATVGVQYFTAYFALVDLGQLTVGKTLLATAASSSTGVAAMQLAKTLGARVIAATRSRKKEALLRQNGADEVIVSGEEDLVERIRALSKGRGVDLIYDPVAGASTSQNIEALAYGGKLIIYGLLDASPATLPVWPLMGKALSIHGYAVFAFMGSAPLGIAPQTQSVARAKQYIIERLADGTLDPLIARTFPLEQVAEAHRFMESNEQVGKIVVRCG